MKPFQLPLFALLLQAYLAKAAPDVIEVERDVEISKDGRTMSFSGGDCESSDFRCTRTCNKGKAWSISDDEEHAACCLPSQHLSVAPTLSQWQVSVKVTCIISIVHCL